MRISKTFRFEAAHRLPNVPEGHPCGRLHGHSYTVDVAVEGPVDARYGWVIDFAVISGAWSLSGGQLDHTLLNDVLPNPTAELLAVELYRLLSESPSVVLPGRVTVTVHETATTAATFGWED